MVRRSAAPHFGMVIINRQNANNMVELIGAGFEFDIKPPYIIFRDRYAVYYLSLFAGVLSYTAVTHSATLLSINTRSAWLGRTERFTACGSTPLRRGISSPGSWHSSNLQSADRDNIIKTSIKTSNSSSSSSSRYIIHIVFMVIFTI